MYPLLFTTANADACVGKLRVLWLGELRACVLGDPLLGRPSKLWERCGKLLRDSAAELAERW